MENAETVVASELFQASTGYAVFFFGRLIGIGGGADADVFGERLGARQRNNT